MKIHKIGTHTHTNTSTFKSANTHLDIVSHDFLVVSVVGAEVSVAAGLTDVYSAHNAAEIKCGRKRL